MFDSSTAHTDLYELAKDAYILRIKKRIPFRNYFTDRTFILKRDDIIFVTKVGITYDDVEKREGWCDMQFLFKNEIIGVSWSRFGSEPLSFFEVVL